MKVVLKRAIEIAIISSLAISSTAIVARADGTRTVGVVAVSYVGTRIDSVSAAIAVGKNSAAGTASITGTETAASAIGSAGTITVVPNPDDPTIVGYRVGAESATELNTAATNPVRSTSIRIDNSAGNNTQVVTVMP
ncbi:hypothetical protein [Chamaesiphon sp. VAR_48_metabat_403]|uniref:hypothetical protein n=1 Tax=Chamaesiphon sp. VAR_48_metabat_403 TaxID=2964700 RepID=UPI00286E7F27|nr:hypothetical protein [Chamaesiphon sp. VAR_48_metabat_403]